MWYFYQLELGLMIFNTDFKVEYMNDQFKQF